MNQGKLLNAGRAKFLAVIIFCLCLFSYKLKAQVLVTGRVTAIASQAPLYPATILDKTSGKAVYADSLGSYRIMVNGGDELQYSYLGFYTKKYKVPEGLTDVIHDVRLISKREKLSEVEIRAMTPYQRDSLDRIQTFKSYLDKPVYPLLDKHSHTNGGFGLTFHPFTYFSKAARQKRHFHKMFPKFEQEEYVNSRYTPQLVTQLTGLKGDSLAMFLYLFKPSYEFTRHATKLEFWSWIKIQYKSWVMPK